MFRDIPLTWLLILFATQFSDASKPVPNNRDRQQVLHLNVSISYIPTEGNSSLSHAEKTDENMKKSNATNGPTNSTVIFSLHASDNATEALHRADNKLNSTKQNILDGFDISRVKKYTPEVEDMVLPLPKLLKKKETGHGKVFLISSFSNNNNMENGNIDTSNYDHNKRIPKDESSHGWKYRKPKKFQTFSKPSLLGSGVNNMQDSNKMIFEVYNKNPNHVDEVHDSKKLTPLLPTRFETMNSNLLIDYLFPSIFKNVFPQINHEPPQIPLINDMGYSDKLVHGWFNLKEENSLPFKCACSRLRKPDEVEGNSKINFPEHYGTFHVIPHPDIQDKDQENDLEVNNLKDPLDKSMILSL